MKELTIIEESERCSWAKCIFCSFSKKEAYSSPDTPAMKEKLEKNIHGNPEILKYFNSGSFLDEKQIPKEFREHLINKCVERGVKELVVESRPEYVTEESLVELINISKSGPTITFALGLEIADNNVLRKICKGFQIKDYVHAAETLKKNGFDVRTYVMANLPFVNDLKKSLADSVNFALKYSNSVAIINTFPRAPAPLFELWVSGNFHPLDRNEFEVLTKQFKKNRKIHDYFDDYVDYPHFSKKEAFIGAREENLIHPHYEVWQEYISRFYEIPDAKKYALFLPCSFRKPYSESKTHREIIRNLISLPKYENIHQIMISNPGVIPREFERKYPFANYDWPEWEETKEIKKKYVKATKERVKNYLARHKYEKIFAYFKPDSESFEALRLAASELGVNFVYCADRKIYEKVKDKDCALSDRKMIAFLMKTLRENIS